MLKLIPSGAPRFVPCPGSAALEAPYPWGPTHPTTLEGIALHWASERVLMSWLPVNNYPPESLVQYLGQVCPSPEAAGTIITDEMVWAGNVYLQEIWNTASTYPEGLIVEKQLSAFHHIPEYSGRTDALWRSLSGSHLFIYDLKFGFIPKKAFENWQLISYALAALDDRTESVTLVLVQPRGMNASRPVMRWTLTVEEFWGYAQVLIDAAAEARGPNPRTVAGPHCRYCKVAAVCDTGGASSMAALDTGSSSVTTDLSNEQLAYEIELLDRAKEIVRARLDAMESVAIARINEGHSVPGCAYRKGLKDRAWTVPPAQMIEIARMQGVDIEERKPMTPKQAEGHGLSRALIDQFTWRDNTAPKLVREDRAKAREVFQK